MPIKKLLKKAQDSVDEYDKKREERPVHLAGHDESNWLVSYADMMTLLCGFFVMLFSMAKIDETKYDKVKQSITKTFGGDFKSTHEEFARFVTQLIQDSSLANVATVLQDPFGVSVVFQSTLFFDTLSSDVKSEAKTIVTKLIEIIAERQARESKQFRILIEGHTDSRPILSGNYPSNWELSGARAARVVRMFADHGFDPKLLTAVGYADTRPLNSGRLPSGELSEELSSQNRRVVVRILEHIDESVIPLTQSTHLLGPLQEINLITPH